LFEICFVSQGVCKFKKFEIFIRCVLLKYKNNPEYHISYSKLKFHTFLYRVLEVRLEGESHSGRPKRRCDDIINLDLKVVGLDSVVRRLWLSIKACERIL